MAFIFVKLHFLFFGGALLRLNGGKKEQKLPIPLNMTPRSYKFGQRYNVSSQIWYRDSFRTNFNFWLFFGNPAGYMVKKGQKMRIPLKLTPRSCKFVQRDNFWREIWYWHSFRTNENFWLVLGDPGLGVQKVSKIAHLSKHTPYKRNICTEE